MRTPGPGAGAGAGAVAITDEIQARQRSAGAAIADLFVLMVDMVGSIAAAAAEHGMAWLLRSMAWPAKMRVRTSRSRVDGGFYVGTSTFLRTAGRALGGALLLRFWGKFRSGLTWLMMHFCSVLGRQVPLCMVVVFRRIAYPHGSSFVQVSMSFTYIVGRA